MSDASHLLLARLDGLPALDALLSSPMPEDLAPEQLHIFSTDLPSQAHAGNWRELPSHQQLSGRWAWRGALLFLPVGLLGIYWGQHWIWLPGMMVSGAVWGYFAHFYMRLFRADRNVTLRELGLPNRDIGLVQSELADGALVLVLQLQALQVEPVEQWLETQNVSFYHVLI